MPLQAAGSSGWLALRQSKAWRRAASLSGVQRSGFCHGQRASKRRGVASGSLATLGCRALQGMLCAPRAGYGLWMPYRRAAIRQRAAKACVGSPGTRQFGRSLQRLQTSVAERKAGLKVPGCAKPAATRCIWGSRPRRIRAAYQFFMFTLFGSLIMLLGLLCVLDLNPSRPCSWPYKWTR